MIYTYTYTYIYTHTYYVGQGYFVRFANGLMNETNALVATTMDKLVEIKKVQVSICHT